ncbi:CBU_0592 family membrane protein [Roseivirga spongicola]
MKTVIDILGWTGSGLIILAYALTLVKNSEYLNYGKYLNLMGGILIAIKCYYYQAIPPFITNLLWSVIATLTIYKSRRTKAKCRKTECFT